MHPVEAKHLEIALDTLRKKTPKLRPCRSPYCECEQGKCTHPGCYDARSESDASGDANG